MPRRKTHTQKWWDAAPQHILRCTGHNKGDGSRCRAEAAPGTTVCDRHGALIPAVQQSAARRIQSSVDQATELLVEWMNDPDVDMRERVKIAHDLLDRGGLAATSKHLVGVVGGAADPVEALFVDLISTPDMLAEPAKQPRAIASRRYDYDPDEDLLGVGELDIADIVDAELVRDEPEPPPAQRRARSARRTGSALPPKRMREDLERLL